MNKEEMLKSPNFPYTILQLIYPYLVSQADTRKVLNKILYHGASLWQKQHSHQEQGHLVNHVIMNINQKP